MKAMKPFVEIPGDNEHDINGFVHPHIMARTGELMGIYRNEAVWRFGATSDSEFAKAYGVSLPTGFPGFVWVLATRKTAKIRETWIGYAIELPARFRNVIDFE